MRKELSISKLLTMLVASFALVTGPFASANLTTSGIEKAADEVYTAGILATQLGENTDVGSTQAKIHFFASKADRDDVDTLNGIFIGQMYVGIKGLLHPTGKSLLSLSGITIKVDAETSGHSASSDAENTDLFLAPAGAAIGSAVGSDNTNAWALSGITVGASTLINGNLASAAAIMNDQAITGTDYNSLNYFDITDDDFSTDPIGTAWASYYNFLRHSDLGTANGSGGNGKRLVNGNMTADAKVDSTAGTLAIAANTAKTGTNSNATASQRLSCHRDWDGTGASGTSGGSCPYYLVNFVSGAVDVNEILNPSTTSVTLTATPAITPPTVTDNTFTHAATLTFTTNAGHMTAG